ncbi:Lrp/AsnC family transcriptional regulator [Aliishimia ponticola]|uniref:Lrp/AsnC family transcriptional regulator n=1 Tax=Aliishimia ponticola TaxID=2499833 RepID=A0A4S4NDH2_9RHOB|nr:Lrp/AsnC family transcriptional regulator [Aliishimia ponticola]THH36795.1 Lrp/AsnC family transcriptional regulator [Aliishimia ponticola]
MAELDEKSREILRILTAHGRISNIELAERVSLSASACLRRVQEMERQGIIEGYRARLGRDKLGIGFAAYLGVGLSQHNKAAQTAFEQAMASVEEVVECHNITGNIEYLLRVECADLKAYKTFHTDVLGSLPMVASITTYVILGSPKDERS